MIGNWKWNFWIAFLTLLLTFIFSVTNHNGVMNSTLNSLYSFSLMFALAFGFRFMLGHFAIIQEDPEHTGENMIREEGIGTHINMATPEDSPLESIFADPAEHVDQGFMPLSPKKLASKDKIDAEFLSDAIRNLSDDEG